MLPEVFSVWSWRLPGRGEPIERQDHHRTPSSEDGVLSNMWRSMAGDGPVLGSHTLAPCARPGCLKLRPYGGEPDCLPAGEAADGAAFARLPSRLARWSRCDRNLDED